MVKNKNFYFLCSLPRAGNTILGSLLNTTNNVKLSANSILPDVLWLLDDIKNNNIFKNFPYTKGLDNVKNNIFNLFN